MKITALHAAVIGWLRYDCRCPIVMLERSPWHARHYRPDVIGITRKWQVIEVEFKQSMADFEANAKKREIWLRERGVGFCVPWKFYWAATRELARQILSECNSEDGMLTDGALDTRWGPQVAVMRGTRPNPLSIPISKREAIRLVMHQTGTLHRLALAAAGATVEL